MVGENSKSEEINNKKSRDLHNEVKKPEEKKNSEFIIPQSQPGEDVLKMEESIVVQKFAEKLVNSYQNFIQAVILFGSITTENHTDDSDIDVLIIVNDINIPFTTAVKNSFDLGVKKYKAEALVETKVKRPIHSNVVGLTEFWTGVRNTDPVVINVLRTGIAIYETGFFVPFKELLLRGEILPSEEGVINLFYVGKSFMEMSQHKIKEAIDALYWAMIKSVQAVLLSKNIYPDLPKNTPAILEKEKDKIKIFTDDDVITIKRLFDDYKKIDLTPNKFTFSAEHYEDVYKKVSRIIEKAEKEVEKTRQKLRDKLKNKKIIEDTKMCKYK